MELGERSNGRSPVLRLLARYTLSLIIVIFTQLALLLIPHCFSSFSLFIQLLLSAMLLLLVAGVFKCFRRLITVRASAPALVFFNIMFVWAVYLAIVRSAVSPLEDLIFNGELVVLVIGFISIVSSDPSVVKYETPDSISFQQESDSKELLSLGVGQPHESTEEVSSSMRRVRYCKMCKAHIRGFDHHCPAFGNCIGQKNHVHFMVLLVVFIAAESSYISGARNLQPMKISLYEKLAVSIMLFSFLQVLWQVMFLAWHVYCVLSNIKTDEWINWKNYPEFQDLSHPHVGQPLSDIGFRNPYDKGVLRNLKEFLLMQE